MRHVFGIHGVGYWGVGGCDAVEASVVQSFRDHVWLMLTLSCDPTTRASQKIDFEPNVPPTIDMKLRFRFGSETLEII